MRATDIENEAPFDDHGGLSGARISRGRLRDGTSVVVKRSSWTADVFQRRLGHEVSLERLLWQDGTLQRLPRGVTVPILGVWSEDNESVIVMRDVGDLVLGQDHEFTGDEAIRLLDRVERLHRAHLRPSHASALGPLISLFSAPALRAEGALELADEIDRGWTMFAEEVPAVALPILKLVADPRPLVFALSSRRSTFCHGDLAAVNLAWDHDDLVLLDWGQAFVGPPALDVARFLPSGLVRSDVDPETFLREYRTGAGGGFDGVALDLAILATVVWYGWRKALDSTSAADPRLRSRERENLGWLCERARLGLSIIGAG